MLRVGKAKSSGDEGKRPIQSGADPKHDQSLELGTPFGLMHFLQVCGHLIKLLYYGAIIGVEEELSAWFLAAAVAAAVLGTRVGTRLLDHFSDHGFRRITGYVILGIGLLCVVSGVRGLLCI